MEDNRYILMLQANAPGSNEHNAATTYFWNKYRNVSENSARKYKQLNNEDREDVSAESFIKTLQKFGEPGFGGMFGSYLKKVVYDKALKNINKKKRAKPNTNEEPIESFKEYFDRLISGLDDDKGFKSYFRFEVNSPDSAFFAERDMNARKYGLEIIRLSECGDSHQQRFIAKRLEMSRNDVYQARERLITIGKQIKSLYDGGRRMTDVEKTIVNLRLRKTSFDEIAKNLRVKRAFPTGVDSIKERVLEISNR